MNPAGRPAGFACGWPHAARREGQITRTPRALCRVQIPQPSVAKSLGRAAPGILDQRRIRKGVTNCPSHSPLAVGGPVSGQNSVEEAAERESAPVPPACEKSPSGPCSLGAGLGELAEWAGRRTCHRDFATRDENFPEKRVPPRCGQPPFPQFEPPDQRRPDRVPCLDGLRVEN